MKKDDLKMDEMKMQMFERALECGVDFSAIQEGIETKTYMIPRDLLVPLHEHPSQDEIFYCVKGEGVGIVNEMEYKFSTGDIFVAPAGSMHTIKSDETMFVLAFLIPVNRMICHCSQVTYGDIRMAMVVNGARTVEDIQSQLDVGKGCGRCLDDIRHIVSMACGCKNVTVEDVINAVESGADTVEKIGEITGAGTDCGKCKMLLQNIIDLGK